MLPENVTADDVCTPEQEETIQRRAARADLHDPERMRKRRIELIRYGGLTKILYAIKSLCCRMSLLRVV